MMPPSSIDWSVARGRGRGVARRPDSVICQGWPLASWRPVNRPRCSHLNTVWDVTPNAAAAPCTE